MYNVTIIVSILKLLAELLFLIQSENGKNIAISKKRGRIMKRIINGIISFTNNIYNYIILKYRHVTIGSNSKINGRIYCVSNSKQGIIIGDNVSINSCLKSNPIGGNERTILFAKGDGKITIGDNCGISNSVIFATKSIQICDNVLIGGNVKIYDTDFHWVDYNKRINEEGGTAAEIIIKEGAFIGAHSIILKGVTIGERSVIGAGSVVTKDIPSDELWVGNPVRFVRKL